MKKIILNLSWIILSLFILVGCNSNDTKYEQAIINGLDHFAAEDYSKAEVYFEDALKENKNDTYAKALLKQTSLYRNAIKFYEEENFQETQETAEKIKKIEDGSKAIQIRAEELLTELEEILADKDINTFEEEKNDHYTYEDFIGYYLLFDSSEEEHAEARITIGQEYFTIGTYRSVLFVYEVQDYEITGNLLTIKGYHEENEMVDEDYNTFEIKLTEDDNEIAIEYNNIDTYYKVTYEEVLDYDYIVQDYLKEDIQK